LIQERQGSRLSSHAGVSRRKMSSETDDLQRIIKRLKQRMAEAERFKRNIKKKIAEVDARLEKLKRKKKDSN
jgi:predicted  nucleic acid-binding Zn-ribbon protein